MPKKRAQARGASAPNEIYGKCYLFPMLVEGANRSVLLLRQLADEDLPDHFTWDEPPYSFPHPSPVGDFKLSSKVAKDLLLGAAEATLGGSFDSWTGVELQGHGDYVLRLLGERQCNARGQNEQEAFQSHKQALRDAADSGMNEWRNSAGDSLAEQRGLDCEKLIVETLREMGIDDSGFLNGTDAEMQKVGLAPDAFLPYLVQWLESKQAVHRGREFHDPRRLLKSRLGEKGIRLIVLDDFPEDFWRTVKLDCDSTRNLDFARAYSSGCFYYASAFPLIEADGEAPHGETIGEFAARVILSIVQHDLSVIQREREKREQRMGIAPSGPAGDATRSMAMYELRERHGKILEEMVEEAVERGCSPMYPNISVEAFKRTVVQMDAVTLVNVGEDGLESMFDAIAYQARDEGAMDPKILLGDGIAALCRGALCRAQFEVQRMLRTEEAIPLQVSATQGADPYARARNRADGFIKPDGHRTVADDDCLERIWTWPKIGKAIGESESTARRREEYGRLKVERDQWGRVSCTMGEIEKYRRENPR